MAPVFPFTADTSVHSAPCVVAIVNVTPDSFFDGGTVDPDLRGAAAISQGIAAFQAGAGVVDVGGESTKPGAARVADTTQIARVLPVVAALAAHGAVSVDTTRAAVAEACLAAGATTVNDVSCLADDADLAAMVAKYGAFLVISHARGGQSQMRGFGAVPEDSYKDVVAEVSAELLAAAARAMTAGVAREKIILDPGIGFDKSTAHSRALLAALPRLVQALPFPVYVGASRKSALAIAGELPGERLAASLAVALHAQAAGVRYLRVHDVADTVRALTFARDVLRPEEPRTPELRRSADA